MKWTKFIATALVACFLTVSAANAQGDLYREQSDIDKMMEKLGRGVTNILTSWVEIPRQVAIEWEKTDPATGSIVGTIKGFGWGFARFFTGAYEIVTFPFPIPQDYDPLIEPEYIVTDIWGAPIPGLTELDANDPEMPAISAYPKQFEI